jgi:hypothetical protein
VNGCRCPARTTYRISGATSRSLSSSPGAVPAGRSGPAPGGDRHAGRAVAYAAVVVSAFVRRAVLVAVI